VLVKYNRSTTLTIGSYIHSAEERPAVSRTRDFVARLDQRGVHATACLLTGPYQHPDDCRYAQQCFDVKEPTQSSGMDPVEWQYDEEIDNVCWASLAIWQTIFT
jgi:hypothetical protein